MYLPINYGYSWILEYYYNIWKYNRAIFYLQFFIVSILCCISMRCTLCIIWTYLPLLTGTYINHSRTFHCRIPIYFMVNLNLFGKKTPFQSFGLQSLFEKFQFFFNHMFGWTSCKWTTILMFCSGSVLLECVTVRCTCTTFKNLY